MTTPSTPRIVVIGAGAGGLSFAIALKRQLGYENYIIYEKASDVGGTWRDNIYPGCSSDTPMHFFSLSTDLNPNWTSTHGSNDEIQRYWKELSAKYAIEPHIAYNHLVHSATWDAAEQLYHIVVEDLKTGTKTSTSAHILISAIGILEVPRVADIPGAKDFAGDVFHSARWNKSVELHGRKVAVIGNGASATQFVPLITSDSEVQVTQFCRTPNWLLSPIRQFYSPRTIWMFRHVPFFMKLARLSEYLRSEVFYFSIFKNSWARGQLTKIFRNYIMKNTPEKYHKHLIPAYNLGCKRVIFDTDYTVALHRPNMDINWDGIDRITEDGILTKKGEKLPFDVMIFATGFTVDRYPINVRGSKGTSVQDYYDSENGPKAYIGTSVPGFPNFFMVSGPNTTTGHTSVIYTGEVQAYYIVKLIKPILNGDVSSFEVTKKATDAYNDKIHKRLSKSVFMTCLSWYRTGGDGRVTSIFPGTSTRFWWWLRRPVWSHYIAVGAERWKRRLRNQKIRRSLLLVTLLVAASLRFLGPAGRGQLILMYQNSLSQLSSQLSKARSSMSW
ncbi:hypothetical protein BD779DRAFT_1440214 [Infundibulicybe gibba]|nr:hypothetical protein BD779DRAFT_1440214 [Infundibulicybe gibba]